MRRIDPQRVARNARLRAGLALGALASGFVLARWLPGVLPGVLRSDLWLAAALLLGSLAMILRGRACALSMLAMATCVGGGWFTLRVLEPPSDLLWLPPDAGGVLVEVEGVVVEPPYSPVPRGALSCFQIGESSHRLVVELRRVAVGAAGDDGDAWRDASGRLILSISGDVDFERLSIGRRVRVLGMASGTSGPTNPGQPDSRLWAAQDGVVGRMAVPDASLIRPAPGAPSLFDQYASAARQARQWLTQRAGAGLESIRDPRARALTASLLLGAEEEEGRAITTTFQRLGLAHVLAISGVHIALLAWATLLGLRLLGDFGALEPALAAGVVVFYMLVVPAEAPVLRSGVMVLALLLGEALGRRYDGVVILIWTAVALLLVRPMDLWSLGFQLSFGVTAVLLGGGRAFHARVFGATPPLRETTIDRPWHRRLADGTLRAVSASFLAWAVASPWIAARVGMVAPLAPISSLVMGVPISLLMVGGFFVLLVSMLVPGAGVLWSALEPVARAALACVDWLDTLPASSIATGSVPQEWGALASVGVLWMLTRARWRAEPLPISGASDSSGIDLGTRGVLIIEPDESAERREAEAGSTTAPGARPLHPSDGRDALLRNHAHWHTWLVLACLLAWLGALVVVGRGVGRDVALRLDTLDVGDASCHLLRSGDEAWMWDCGSSWAGAGEVQIPGALRALGIPPVRTAVITHANFDHFNCLPDVAWRLGVRRVLVSPLLIEVARAQPRGATATMLALLNAQGVQVDSVRAGDRFRLGDADVTFLWPTPEPGRGLSANDQSLVAMIEVSTEAGVRRVLMTGDIQTYAIAAILGPRSMTVGGGGDPPGMIPANNPDGRLRADVMELPHHGAFTRDTAELVQVVGPVVVVQSTGRTGAGLARAIDPRWSAMFERTRWLCTARHGATWVEVQRNGQIDQGATLDPP